jgi:hypothetical protein
MQLNRKSDFIGAIRRLAWASEPYEVDQNKDCFENGDTKGRATKVVKEWVK